MPHTSLLALATEMLKAGRPADAIAPLREAARRDPGNSVIQHDLGLACLEAGQLPEAIEALQRAIGGEPNYADAHFRLGIASEKLGDGTGAIAAYYRATELAPGLTEAWFRAGALVDSLGHREEATACFHRASATGGNSSFGRLGKARALLAEDRMEEAEKVLRRTVTRDPENALAHELLGNLLSELGRFDEARPYFERVVEMAPLLAGAYYELVRCQPVTKEGDARLVAQMEASLETPGLEAGQQLRVHLAIGKAAEDLGDYERAMRHFDAADEIRRPLSSFDSATFSTEIDYLIARCTPEWIAQCSRSASDDATPILILGMPRSGTTLVEQIVSMHPQVGAGGELPFWNVRGLEWHRSGQRQPGFAADYLRVLRRIAPKAMRVTDKMPFNFLWAGLIHATFPRAIILHCQREALDTALSIHQTHFHPGVPFPTGGTDLVEYFRAYKRLMDHWRRVLPEDRFVEVNYEELTREPEPIIRKMIAACGLPWDQACLHPEANKRAVHTPSKWQTRQPIYRSSAGRWKRYEPWLGPLRELQIPCGK